MSTVPPPRWLVWWAMALAAMACSYAKAAPIFLTCTNPYSGTRWQIAVDWARSTVDGNAAQISDTEISWHDAKDNANYRLDRSSGRLTVVMPSSTGGYFLYDQCEFPR
jgi:hypothetical protein